jgi:hypothetical protein
MPIKSRLGSFQAMLLPQLRGTCENRCSRIFQGPPSQKFLRETNMEAVRRGESRLGESFTTYDFSKMNSFA